MEQQFSQNLRAGSPSIDLNEVFGKLKKKHPHIVSRFIGSKLYYKKTQLVNQQARKDYEANFNELLKYMRSDFEEDL